jgi:hypothetical protein
MRPPPPHLVGFTVDHPGPTKHVRRAVDDGVFWCGAVTVGGVRDLSVWCSGFTLDEHDDIVFTSGPIVVEVRTPDTTLVVFDERVHGHDAIIEDLTGRPVEPPHEVGDNLRVVCWAGYSIQWEGEKNSWIRPGEECFTTPTGRKLAWEELTRAAFDAFGVLVERDGEWIELMELELA